MARRYEAANGRVEALAMLSPSVRSLPDRVKFIDVRPSGVHLVFRRGADTTLARERLVTIQCPDGQLRLIQAGQLLEHDIVKHLH